MQKAYLMALYELAQKDKRVLSLLADSGTGYDELFQREFPDQLVDFGIAEEHMVSAAKQVWQRAARFLLCIQQVPF